MSDYEGKKCYVAGYSIDENETYTFIKFGTMKAYKEDNTWYPVDCAILESDDGNIISVEPSSIKFVD